MTINLSKPLDDAVLSNSEKHFLHNLQGNILKGHGREHVVLVFLAVKKVDEARAFLRQWPITDALTQHKENEAFKQQGVPGGLVRLAFLSRSGLVQFGHGNKFTGLGAFDASMAADTPVLDQGTTQSWQAELKQPTDVLLLLAHHDRDTLAHVVAKLITPWDAPTAAFKVRFVQEGNAFKNEQGVGIEHFGYVDGRSQPLMVRSDIEAERQEPLHAPAGPYDPASPLSQFLIPDPLDPQAHGSFFVFRKLEQNVAGFKQAEKDLAATLGLQGDDAERAGAMVVGRFEDGTPVTLSADAAGGPVPNNFTFEHDPSGGRCPMHAHIRKANPRGASPGGATFDKGVQMARRGITYGNRLQDPVTKEFIDKPNDGVGLLFMSYQASIDQQFRFMQTQWVDNENFPKPGVGVDPVLSSKGTLAQNWPQKWGQAQPSKPSLFHGFVTLKGGEYFYTPSVSGLKNL